MCQGTDVSHRENIWRPPTWEQAKAIYAELAAARESTIFPYVLSETQRQAEEGESSIVEEIEGFRNRRCPGWRRLLDGGILCDLSEGHIWLPLVGPKLEVGIKVCCRSFIRSWAFWAECCRGYWLAFCIVIRDSRLIPGLVTVDERLAPCVGCSRWVRALFLYIGHCHFYIQFLSSPLVILLLARGWPPIQEELEIQIFATWRLSSCLHNHLCCKIFLILLLYHHGNHLMRELLPRSI